MGELGPGNGGRRNTAAPMPVAWPRIGVQPIVISCKARPHHRLFKISLTQRKVAGKLAQATCRCGTHDHKHALPFTKLKEDACSHPQLSRTGTKGPSQVNSKGKHQSFYHICCVDEVANNLPMMPKVLSLNLTHHKRFLATFFLFSREDFSPDCVARD